MRLANGSEFVGHIYFQHGWGFNRSCFKDWPKLFIDWQCTLIDRGYWGAALTLDEAVKADWNVLVCHSLGLHFFSQAQLNSFDLLVVLGGFACFHGVEPTNTISRKHLQRMRLRLAKEPEQLLADFYRDCSWPYELPDFSTINPVLLEQDLLLLDSVMFSHRVLQNTRSILIHGSKDRLVPPGRAHELQSILAGQLYEIDGAGHGVLFTHRDHCVELIKNHINEYKR